MYIPFVHCVFVVIIIVAVKHVVNTEMKYIVWWDSLGPNIYGVIGTKNIFKSSIKLGLVHI